MDNHVQTAQLSKGVAMATKWETGIFSTLSADEFGGPTIEQKLANFMNEHGLESCDVVVVSTWARTVPIGFSLNTQTERFVTFLWRKST